MQKLNLPAAPLTIREVDGHRRVLDPLRKRFVALTPEEWVRQHFVYYLIAFRGYPAGLMGNEVSLQLNGTSRRCDTVVADSAGNPWMIVEYKAPEIHLDERVFAQILRYNLTLGAKYLTVSNGLTTYCCAIDATTGRATFLPELPSYP
ncbi:MAG: type I restriction enzyme HsdR N-terminal domain-containing protein [Bacteroidales bacterium]|nr:type I restriction enzyme HsdR N-terminal domain-containing protein [Bacteroidales bacterium]MDE6801877.1 type I restriction enzyme HsdR N-terminal domain-containing protein [Muribaculaceae bacterium]MDE6831127.1 type I restriction enzyme HsdR N-terminal domain-containing protein [Muribaculaceae bacterium]